MKKTQPHQKQKKISELKRMQQQWMNDMKISQAQPPASTKITTEPTPIIIAKPTEIKKADILTDNWCHLSSNKPTNILNCSLCQNQLVYPQLVVPCGHTFCEKCLVTRMEKHNTCANCHNPIQGHFPNLALQEMIQQNNNTAKNVDGPVADLNTFDFDQDPSDLAKRYRLQLDQLQARCDLLHDELDDVTIIKAADLKSSEASITIVHDSTEEMRKIHENMVIYAKRITELEEIVSFNHENVLRLKLEIEEHCKKEACLKETLGLLIKRREKVRAIYTGPLNKMADSAIALID